MEAGKRIRLWWEQEEIDEGTSSFKVGPQAKILTTNPLLARWTALDGFFGEHKKLMPFFQKAKKYLLNVCRTREETSKKCGFSNMEFKRRHQPEMLYRTDWLIEQQIAWYFSRISALTKAGLLKRFCSVIMNKDEEVDADDLVSETDRTRQKIRRDLEKFRRRPQGRVQLTVATGYKKKYRPLHLTFLSNLSSLPMKTTGYVLGFFHHGKFAGSLLVKILLAHSSSHAIQSR